MTLPDLADGEADAVVLIPVYNDWAALRLLLPALDAQLASAGLTARVLVVDDASEEPPPPSLVASPMRALSGVDVVALRRNLGHQRAIAIGLGYLEAHSSSRLAVVMDGDGEDLPSDVPRLIAACVATGGSRIVFAQRARRSEGLVFTTFYKLFRVLHRLLTGLRVEVGNFSVVPRGCLRRLVFVSELWNHYAAATVHARLPRTLVPTVRGTRLDGRSHMNFVGLVGHGLSAMSVFSDRIGVRLLAVTSVLAGLLGLGIVGAVGIRLLTDLAVPGWATVATGVLSILLFQAVALSTVFVFMIQTGRAGVSFIPHRDYPTFIEAVTNVWSREDGLRVHRRRAGGVRARDELEGVLREPADALRPWPGPRGGRGDR